jgi:hypothetical protein
VIELLINVVRLFDKTLALSSQIDLLTKLDVTLQQKYHRADVILLIFAYTCNVVTLAALFIGIELILVFLSYFAQTFHSLSLF